MDDLRSNEQMQPQSLLWKMGIKIFEVKINFIFIILYENWKFCLLFIEFYFEKHYNFSQFTLLLSVFPQQQ